MSVDLHAAHQPNNSPARESVLVDRPWASTWSETQTALVPQESKHRSVGFRGCWVRFASTNIILPLNKSSVGVY